jgi:hypothetical protein
MMESREHICDPLPIGWTNFQVTKIGRETERCQFGVSRLACRRKAAWCGDQMERDAMRCDHELIFQFDVTIWSEARLVGKLHEMVQTLYQKFTTMGYLMDNSWNSYVLVHAWLMPCGSCPDMQMAEDQGLCAFSFWCRDRNRFNGYKSTP